MLASEDKQISLTDPDARSMATSGKDTGIVGYNVQAAVDTEHHLIVAHEVTNVGTDRHQLSNMADQARTGWTSRSSRPSPTAVTTRARRSKPVRTPASPSRCPSRRRPDAKAEGRFGKQDFVYNAADDTYRCPAGERLSFRYQVVDKGKTIRRYWTGACGTCGLKDQCTKAPQRHIRRWEHEAVLEKVQARLDHNPDAMRVRRSTAEHPFGTIKCWMGATHFLTMTLPKVATEMALNVLAYNMKRVIAIMGVDALLEAMAE